MRQPRGVARIDYLDDPNAPPANSLVPSVNVVVTNDDGHMLMICRTDNDNWSLPGGAIDLGESLIDAAVRETKEETGVDTEITGLVGIYTNPRHVIEYTSDGEVRQEFSIVLTARPTGGATTPSNESSQVVWVAADKVPDLRMHSSMRQRIEHHLKQLKEPYLG
jgi:ADP-ribose pyrophosphatase YjhB (NUDIX family)